MGEFGFGLRTCRGFEDTISLLIYDQLLLFININILEFMIPKKYEIRSELLVINTGLSLLVVFHFYVEF